MTPESTTEPEVETTSVYYVFFYPDQYTTPHSIWVAKSYNEANKVMFEDSAKRGRSLLQYEIVKSPS